MDETVIEKIAEQLGIAADKATQFLGQIIPQYAGMRAFDSFSVGLCFLIAALFFYIAARFLYLNSKTWVVSDDMGYDEKEEAEKNYFCSLVGFFVCTVLGVLFLLVTISSICDTISWLCFPEAHVFQMVLNKF